MYLVGDFTRMWDFTWRVSDCEELMEEVNNTTECVIDLANGNFAEILK